MVRSCVAQVLGTLCASDSGTTQGELPWRSDFGCLLPLLRHRGLTDATKQLARVYVANALAKWEPRARVRSVSVDSVERDGGLALVVSLRYDVVAGATSNQVFVPDVSQVVYIPAA